MQTKINTAKIKQQITASFHQASLILQKYIPIKTRRHFQQDWLKWTGAALTIILLLVIGTKIFKNPSSNAQAKDTSVVPAQNTIELNREFTFPIRGEEGVEIGKEIKYTIERVELADQIVVKGTRATALDGRTFLLLYIKLTNNEDVGIEIDTRDYVRITIDDSEENLAADIHNDPVEVQPLSTKFTRIGFPVNDTVKKIKLIIGEIKGDKQEVQIDL